MGILAKVRSWWGYGQKGRIPETPSAWEEFWKTNDDPYSVAGIHPRTALSVAAFWQAVSLISGDVAGLPLVLTDDSRDPENAWRTHPAYFVCRYKPILGFDAFQWWRRYMVSALIWGNAYARIHRNGRGEVIALEHIDPQYVQWDPAFQRYYINPPNTIPNLPPILFPSEVLHIEELAFDHHQTRIDKWRRLSLSLGINQTVDWYINEFFGRGGQNSGLLQVPAATTKKARENLEKDFAAVRSGQKGWFKTIPLLDGITWQRTGDSFRDLELNAMRDHQIAEVARMMNLPPSKLGLQTNVSYASLIEEQKSYYNQTLGPWLRSIQQECWSKLITDSQQRSENYFFVHDLQPLFNDKDLPALPQEQPRPAQTSSPTAEDNESNEPVSSGA